MDEEYAVSVSEKEQKDIVQWVTYQIDTALADRSDKEKKWLKWYQQYEEILPEKKSFPWPGCSNISIPITPIAVETIHAREVNTLFAVRPYVNVKPKKRKSDKTNCAMIEVFYDQLAANTLDLYNKCSEWLLEKNKMGTGYMKVYWCHKKVKNADGSFTETAEAELSPVAIEDFIYPANATNIQTCSFVAQRIRTTYSDLMTRQAMGQYKDVEKVKGFVETRYSYSEQSSVNMVQEKDKLENLQRTDVQALGEYVIHEVYFDYDIDGDGFPERTVMTLHKESGTVLRWIRFPYKHGRRPFVPNRYMIRSGRVDGKGICEMSEYLADATNTTFNQTIDNMTLANAKVFKARKQAKEDMPKEGIYPGCTIYLDDPATDLTEFMMGDIKASNFNVIALLRDYHERRTKVTDYSLGRESSTLKSRATATGTLALLQESGRHFDLVINNSRQALVEIAYQVLELYMQYDPTKILKVIGEGDDDDADVFLPPVESLREEYEFYCAATSLTVNKEIEKQTNLIMIQQLGGLYNQMIQLLMLTNNPQAPLPEDVKGFVHGVLRSYFAMAQDLVRSFEKIDLANYVPDLPQTVEEAYGQGVDMMSMIKQMMGGANGGPGAGGMGGAGELPGVGTVPEEMSIAPKPSAVFSPGTSPYGG